VARHHLGARPWGGVKKFLFASLKNEHVAFRCRKLDRRDFRLGTPSLRGRGYGSLCSLGRAPRHGDKPHVVLRATNGVSALEVPAVLRVAISIWRTASVVSAPCVRRVPARAESGVALLRR